MSSDDDGDQPALDFAQDTVTRNGTLDSVITDPAESVIPLNPVRSSTAVIKRKEDQLLPDISSSCICAENKCYEKFPQQAIELSRMQYSQLSSDELDIALLAKIESGIHMEDETRKSKRSQQTQRKCHRTEYFHRGVKICRKFFRYLHCIGDDKLSSLIKHYRENGVEPRLHGNSKKLPKNALDYKDSRSVVDFILNFASIHAIQLPGRTPKHWNSNIQLLPTDCNKSTVYAQYKAAMEAKSATDDPSRCVSLRSFQRLWKSLVPFVCTMPPASDLCWTCQQLSSNIKTAANREAERETTMNLLQDHLRVVKMERAYYQDICKIVKLQIPTDRPLGSYPACSFNGKHHVSFDFAQQVHYPSDPLQPGPIFFKTPRKCGLFGVNSEGCGVQINYLIDEAHSTGKGGNVVISLLHDYLENHSLGETDLYLHADNCAGQNKNNQMLWYLMWRCLTKRNMNIHLSFLIAGHTKFSPDGGFGLIKRKYRRTKINCLQDILDVVNSSSEMNIGKLVGTENGPTQVLTYDWTQYLSQFFSRVKGIKTSHHFSFDSTGYIKIKENINSDVVSLNLTKKIPKQNEMPVIIQASGLSAQRQAYLYKEIRPFVAEDKRDIVTPLPSDPIPDNTSDDSEEDIHEAPAKKTKRQPQNPGVQQRGRGRGRGRRRGRGRDQVSTTLQQ